MNDARESELKPEMLKRTNEINFIMAHHEEIMQGVDNSVRTLVHSSAAELIALISQNADQWRDAVVGKPLADRSVIFNMPQPVEATIIAKRNQWSILATGRFYLNRGPFNFAGHENMIGVALNHGTREIRDLSRMGVFVLGRQDKLDRKFTFKVDVSDINFSLGVTAMFTNSTDENLDNSLFLVRPSPHIIDKDVPFGLLSDYPLPPAVEEDDPLSPAAKRTRVA